MVHMVLTLVRSKQGRQVLMVAALVYESMNLLYAAWAQPIMVMARSGSRAPAGTYGVAKVTHERHYG